MLDTAARGDARATLAAAAEEGAADHSEQPPHRHWHKVARPHAAKEPEEELLQGNEAPSAPPTEGSKGAAGSPRPSVPNDGVVARSDDTVLHAHCRLVATKLQEARAKAQHDQIAAKLKKAEAALLALQTEQLAAKEQSRRRRRR